MITAIEKGITEFQSLIKNIDDGSIQLSHSSFNAFCKSPKHFIDYKMKKFESTDAMNFGSMVHALILEPERFEMDFAIAPRVDRRTTAGKDEWAFFCEENEGKTIVKNEDYQNAKAMQGAIFNNPASKNLIFQIEESEQSASWEYGGFKWRGIKDGVGESIVIDLKVMADATPKKVYYKILEMCYHRQGCHYTRLSGLDNHDFYIIAIDRACNICTYRITNEIMDKAEREIDFYLMHFQKCALLNEWDKSYDFYAEDGVYEFNSKFQELIY